MKITFALVLATATLTLPVPAHAGCKVIEYAELKDMSKDQLILTFGNYRFTADIQGKAAAADMVAYKRTGDPDFFRDWKQDSGEQVQCLQEKERVAQVLAKYYQITTEPTEAEVKAAADALHAAKQKSAQ